MHSYHPLLPTLILKGSQMKEKEVAREIRFHLTRSIFSLYPDIWFLMHWTYVSYSYDCQWVFIQENLRIKENSENPGGYAPALRQQLLGGWVEFLGWVCRNIRNRYVETGFHWWNDWNRLASAASRFQWVSGAIPTTPEGLLALCLESWRTPGKSSPKRWLGKSWIPNLVIGKQMILKTKTKQKTPETKKFLAFSARQEKSALTGLSRRWRCKTSPTSGLPVPLLTGWGSGKVCRNQI